MKKLLTAFAAAALGLGTIALVEAPAAAQSVTTSTHVERSERTVTRDTPRHRAYHHKRAQRVCTTKWRHHKRVRTCRTVWR